MEPLSDFKSLSSSAGEKRKRDEREELDPAKKVCAEQLAALANSLTPTVPPSPINASSEFRPLVMLQKINQISANSVRILPKPSSNPFSLLNIQQTVSPIPPIQLPQVITIDKNPKNKITGWGTLNDKQGEYNGDIVAGKRHGKGKQTAKNGDYYEGEFKNNLKEGIGTIIFKSGDQYTGEWINGLMHGKGKMQFKDRSIYEGDFKESRTDGMGIYKYSNGDKYEGECARGMKNGIGRYTSAKGDIYQGEYKNDKMHGVGTHVSPNGDTFMGEWKEDKRNGQGRLITKENEVYEGFFEEFHIVKYGQITFSNGDSYKGEVKLKNFKNVPHGQGIFIGKNGQYIYEGSFKNGQYHGYGKEIDGSVYEGNFQEGKKLGQGKLTVQQDGYECIYEGSFFYQPLGVVKKIIKKEGDVVSVEEGYIVNGQFQGKVLWKRFQKGELISIYKGPIHYNPTNEKGTLTFMDSTVKTGLVINGKFVESK